MCIVKKNDYWITWKVLHDGDFQFAQIISISHPRQHKQLWGVNGPATDNDLLVSKYLNY